MRRSLLALLAASCIIGAIGCTMCANPYDECGPTSDCRFSQGGGPNARAGSVISGGYGPTVYAGDVAGQVNPLPSPTPPAASGAKKPNAVEPIPAENWDSGKPLSAPKGGTY